MNEMIDRVAKAIYEAMPHDGQAQAAFEPPWGLYVNQARAAIEAMREPTEAMLTEAGYCDDEEYADGGRHWSAMIRAALKNDTPPKP